MLISVILLSITSIGRVRLRPSQVAATSGTGRVVGKCYTSAYSQGIGIPGIDLAVNEYAFFAQDDFRVSPRFTLNMGLRWEYQKLPGVILPNPTTTIIPVDDSVSECGNFLAAERP